jgi:probable rRNA maturation factor
MDVLIVDLQDRRIDTEFVRRVAGRAADVKAHAYGAVSIALVGDDQIADLNRVHLGRRRPTDVLAYGPDAEEPGYMGDVVVSTDTAARQAQEAGRPLLHEVAWLAAHGVLHLLGYDDAGERERARMLALQDRALADVLNRGGLTSREKT